MPDDIAAGLVATRSQLVKPRTLWRSAFWGVLVGVFCIALSPLDQASLPLDTGWDKSNHALTFLVLGMLGAFGWPRKLHLVLALLLLFGVVIEIAQSFTRARQAELIDLLADTLGLLLAWLFAGLGALARRRAQAVADGTSRNPHRSR